MLSTRPKQMSTLRLSFRELEVLRLTADGHASKMTANLLCLSKRSVDSHLAKVYRKLRVKNRISAINHALRLGLLPFEPNSRRIDTV